jgi:hypothetical protein
VSTLAVNSVTDANGGNTATINSMTPTADSLQGFRNRIINGDMRIDQRNAGASVTVTGSGPYIVDRFFANKDTSGATVTAQQSSTAPTGFVNSILWTTSTGSAPAAGNDNFISQKIEGTNISDLGWGTASAKTVTISFWVRSSVTGTYGVALRNSGGARSYVASYTISAANTFEQKTIAIPGDTSGTWLTTSGIGIWIDWDLGCGTDRSTTAGTWQSGSYPGLTGGTKLVDTSGATWYITGVQLEVGSVATPFERRPYGTELALCQRYYYKNINSSGGARNMFTLQPYNTTSCFGKMFDFPVQMRATPSINTSGTFTGSQANGSSAGSGTFSTLRATTNFVEVNAFTGMSGLVAGNASVVIANDAAFVELSSEL